jgi:hypothetical protein
MSYEKNGRKYIGSRTCYDCTPEEDEYLGSYTDKTFNPTHKEILAICETRNEADLIESFLHHSLNVGHSKEYANKAQGCFCYGLYGSDMFNNNIPCPFNCGFKK